DHATPWPRRPRPLESDTSGCRVHRVPPVSHRGARMPTLPVTTRAAMAIALAGVTASLLTGCFANPVEELVNRSVEGAIEEATGGDVNLSGQLPADFPAEVPVVEGKIGLSAGAGGTEGWIVAITTSSNDALADAAA